MKWSTRLTPNLTAISFGVLLAVMSTNLRGVTLDDFGYQKMKVNGQLALGARPTLVILLDLANTGTFAHPTSYYDDLVFNFFNTTPAGVRSVNGFFMENSHGRFFLNRAGAGIIGPLQLNATDRAMATTNDVARGGIAINAAVAAGFNFAPYDANEDGTITAPEVMVMIFDNLTPNDSGAARWANPTGPTNSLPFVPPGSSKAISMSVGLLTQRVSFGTLCHEVSHIIGTKDLYGVWSVTCHGNQYNLMSCTITNADDMATFGLDAWHKLQLGWVEPRIRNVGAGGIESITAAQLLSATDAPIILYDPAHGTGEFFLIEYRTRTSPWGSGYDANIPTSGLGIWHVVHKPDFTIYEWAGLGQSVWLQGQPSLQRGQDANQLWTSGTTTPPLFWMPDGTNSMSLATYIRVRPFTSGAGSITVEWVTGSDTWVHFSYVGSENGTFANPFNTFAEGVAAASYGGFIKLKPGSSAETVNNLSKALVLEAVGGAVTIGQ
ncbi:MAG TPA: hypothetical protein VFZ59_15215 [Verrucomicrobiae bacterium]|nr:hypothetical protein [Verrucomicrobiae bacterium]